MAEPVITFGIVNYNGDTTLVPVIESLLKQRGVKVAEILLADNQSTDRSVEVVSKAFPTQVRIIPIGFNRGPNPARNRLLREASSDWVVIMDNDIVLAPDYASRLATVFDAHPEAGAATGQIRLYDRPDTIQYNGAFIHYAGEVVANRRYGSEPVPVTTVSAGAALIHRPKAAACFYFDEDFLFGWEDGDLTFRMTIAGYPCYAVSNAICYHMRDSRGMKWVRYQVRNRWWFIFKHYSASTILLAFPGILFYQLCAGAFCAMKGRGLDFLRGTWDSITSLGTTLRKRREILKIKTRRDRDTLSGGPIELPGQVHDKRAVMAIGRAVNGVLSLYWKLIRPLMR